MTCSSALSVSVVGMLSSGRMVVVAVVVAWSTVETVGCLDVSVDIFLSFFLSFLFKKYVEIDKSREISPKLSNSSFQLNSA